jgi:hypothetical protein
VYSRDFHSGNRGGHDLRDLLEFETLVDFEDDGLALVGGKFAERARNGQGQFDGGRRALPPMVSAPSRVSGWSSPVSPSGPPLAEERIGLVMGDAVQPRGEPRRIIQFAEILVCLQENVLTQIQSVFAVGDDAQQVIVDAPLPSGNEQVIGLNISPGTPYESGRHPRPPERSKLRLHVGKTPDRGKKSDGACTSVAGCAEHRSAIADRHSDDRRPAALKAPCASDEALRF